jgi:hypothetical protein
VKSPPTGRYQLQVVYAEQDIASDPDLTGLFVWKSSPITVQVTNRTAGSKQRFYPWPVIGLFFLLAVGFRIAELWRRRSDSDAPSAPAKWWSWRDLVAFALLVALAAGWILELRSLEAAIADVRPDREADWSMEMIKD